eukprot:scaffold5340_cov257-Pinguiococcus_pyrenoidosus.AAC.8
MLSRCFGVQNNGWIDVTAGRIPRPQHPMHLSSRSTSAQQPPLSKQNHQISFQQGFTTCDDPFVQASHSVISRFRFPVPARGSAGNHDESGRSAAVLRHFDAEKYGGSEPPVPPRRGRGDDGQLLALLGGACGGHGTAVEAGVAVPASSAL